jgi:hypothetical protein
MYLNNSLFLSWTNLLTAIALLTFTIGVPLWSFKVLHKNRKMLELKKIRAKYENMYVDIHLTRNKGTIFYWPIFMLRKWMYIIIPVMFFRESIFQIQFILFMQTAYVCWYANIKPHWQRSRFLLEMFNEVMVMLLFYMMVVFSRFNTNPETFFMFGNAYLIVVAGVLLVNVALMIYSTIMRLKRKL